jgi:two-component system NarL family sensor kinase
VLSSDDLPLLHTVGDLVSIAIERGRLFAQSAQLGAIEERNRLAREIHDTLAQGLTGISLKLESIDAMLEMNVAPDKIRQTVTQALELTRHNLEEARRSVLDLRAAPLEGQNLADALTTLVEDYSDHPFSINLKITGGTRPLPLRLEAGLYRMIQESLTNIARHAQAQRVTIDLVVTPDQLQLVVEDDGQGFDPSQTPHGSFGLIGLNERVKLLGGRLKIESSPGQGVRINVEVPLTEGATDV